MNQTSSDLETIHRLLSEFSAVMLVTHAGDGRLHARPMAVAELGEDCRVTLITGRESAKAHEIEADTRVHLVCQKDRSAYLSIEARASLREDRAEIARVWKEPFRVWFPGGVQDPNIALIEVEPLEAEYWNNEGVSKVRYLWEAARAYVTGTRPTIREGEQHGVVTL